MLSHGSSLLQIRLWSSGPRRVCFNLIWYLKWTDRCSCPHWEILYLDMFKSILISPCLSGMKAHSYNLSSNVNMCTYAGLKLRRLQILKGSEIISVPRVHRRTARGNKCAAFLCCVQITEQAYIICNAQHSDKIAVWLLPISHRWSAVRTVQADKTRT